MEVKCKFTQRLPFRRYTPKGEMLYHATHCALCDGLLAPLDADPNHPLYRSIDHIRPKSKGGTNELSNLRVAHRHCNELRGNGDTELVIELSRKLHEIHKEYQRVCEELHWVRKYNREESE